MLEGVFMKKMLFALVTLTSVSAFASESMTCIAHGLRSGSKGAEQSLNNMSRYGKRTVSLSDNFIRGYALAIEMESEGNENNIFPLTKIEIYGSYSIYSINDSYGLLCINN